LKKIKYSPPLLLRSHFIFAADLTRKLNIAKILFKFF
jgi:hypothetical protein